MTSGLRPAWVVMAVIFGSVIGGCAATEGVDGEDEAVAVATPAQDVDDPQKVDKSQKDAAEAVSDEPPRERLTDAFSALSLDPQTLNEGDQQALDEQSIDTLGALGILPSSQLCDGAPCGFCEAGVEASFQLDAEPIAVRSCCEDKGRCVSQIYFGDDESSLALVGDGLEPIHFSLDQQKVVLSPSGSTVDDGEIFFVYIEDLRARAQPVEENTPVFGSEEFSVQSSFGLKVRDMHRLENLSARALDEARSECEAGDSVYLPELFRLSEDATPLTERLEIEFERWSRDGELVLTSISNGEGWTSMIIDPPSRCMKRYARGEPSQERIAEVQLEESLRFEKHASERLNFGDRREGLVVIRGELVVDAISGDPGERLRLDATVRHGDQWIDDRSVAVASRHVSDAEFDWWSRGDDGIDELAPPELDAALSYQDGRWHLPVTIIVDGDADVFIVELFKR